MSALRRLRLAAGAGAGHQPMDQKNEAGDHQEADTEAKRRRERSIAGRGPDIGRPDQEAETAERRQSGKRIDDGRRTRAAYGGHGFARSETREQGCQQSHLRRN